MVQQELPLRLGTASMRDRSEPKALRCAIYTRKSSEEGLEHDFNSLHAQQVSFVSVTQAFNTTTSMGRLTLNVLLSFAQFEREVTGERIRDKIAASKRKGMWMGGFVPLGYEPQNRTLVIDEGEADTVRSLFVLYLKL